MEMDWSDGETPRSDAMRAEQGGQAHNGASTDANDGLPERLYDVRVMLTSHTEALNEGARAVSTGEAAHEVGLPTVREWVGVSDENLCHIKIGKDLAADAEFLDAAGRFLRAETTSHYARRLQTVLSTCEFVDEIVTFGAEERSRVKQRLHARQRARLRESFHFILDHEMKQHEEEGEEEEDGDRRVRRTKETTLEDWAFVGRCVGTSFVSMEPAFSFLRGGLLDEDEGPSEHKEKKQREGGREKKVEAVVLKKREQEDEEGYDATVAAELERVKHYLDSAFKRANNPQRIPYWSFVLDPEKFATTVENIFHFSFLVNNSICALITDDGEVYIERVSEEQQEEAKKGKGEMNHLIISIDYRKWKQLLEQYKVICAAIPRVERHLN